MDGDKRSSEKIKSDKSSEKMIQVSDNISGFEVEVPGGHHDWVSGVRDLGGDSAPLRLRLGQVPDAAARVRRQRRARGQIPAGVGGVLHARHDDAAALELLHRRQ